ncbi:MAG: carboxymuconolactone decarboxylase family protein [Bryobacteraceae bacterium]|jgi:alkyl hydroperoxide reductase subunit D
MSIETLLESCPDYAKDLKLNLGTLLRQPDLTEQQTWGSAVAAAMAGRNAQVIRAVLEDAGSHLSEQALFAAKAAAAVMGMNNIFYRFRHFSSNPKYAETPARLRMQVMRTHGADPTDFELWCLVASAVNGCAICVDSHEKVLRERGMTEESIIAAVRLASVVSALSGVMAAEAAAPVPVSPVP